MRKCKVEALYVAVEGNSTNRDDSELKYLIRCITLTVIFNATSLEKIRII